MEIEKDPLDFIKATKDIFIIKKEDISLEGTIDNVDIGNATMVICNKIPLLKKLPCWNNVQDVICIKCENLIELPLWPKIKYVCFHGCPLIKTLPLWTTIEHIYCGYDNPMVLLYDFKIFKSLKYVNYDYLSRQQ